MTILSEVIEVVSKNSGKKRLCLTMRLQDGSKQAFYQSTGTNGHSNTGQWIPFHGIWNNWFVKALRNKVPLPGTELAQISEWLGTQQIKASKSFLSSDEGAINTALLLLNETKEE